jgi:hypothetical protein
MYDPHCWRPCCNPDPVDEPDKCTKAADELERLRRWQREADRVLNDWEEVWLAAGSPGLVGQSIPHVMKRWVEERV